MHSECLTGDVLGSRRCDCGPQLDEALHRLAGEGGLLLYLRQEGRGIGLYAKLDAYVLQDDGPGHLRGEPRPRLRGGRPRLHRRGPDAAALGVDRVALLTNNADKVDQLEALGIEVVERVPTGVHRSDANGRYLATKLRRHPAPFPSGDLLHG